MPKKNNGLGLVPRSRDCELDGYPTEGTLKVTPGGEYYLEYDPAPDPDDERLPSPQVWRQWVTPMEAIAWWLQLTATYRHWNDLIDESGILDLLPADLEIPCHPLRVLNEWGGPSD